MGVSLIVAMAENRVIGRDGELPWRIPGDMRHFKATTMGKPVVMGRKTWESLARPLPGRANIIVTRDPSYGVEGAYVAHDIDAALALAAGLTEGMATDGDEVMVIGGAEIYAQTLGRADRLYLTEVRMACDGDALFPEFDADEWTESSRADVPPEGETPGYCMRILDRIQTTSSKVTTMASSGVVVTE
ncbi:MAG: dihydrofolate reductase [Alphaproteobacteria bacterium]